MLEIATLARTHTFVSEEMQSAKKPLPCGSACKYDTLMCTRLNYQQKGPL